MQDRPTSRELLDAVTQFLSAELVPALGDPRLRFRTLVAANVLTVLQRELELSAEFTRAEWHRLNALMGEDAPGSDIGQEINVMTRALCVRIRSGEADAGPIHGAVFDHVHRTTIEKLQIANPKYLERVSKESS